MRDYRDYDPYPIECHAVYTPPMPTDWDTQVEVDKKKRAELRLSKLSCPECFEPGLTPMGGAGTCWFECPCGAYSELCRTWEEAHVHPNWRNVDPELNARMNPPVGGLHGSGHRSGGSTALPEA